MLVIMMAGMAVGQLVGPGGDLKFLSLPSSKFINFQGKLEEGGRAFTGTKKFQFAIYDDPQMGNLLWRSQEYASIQIENGLFNVLVGPLDHTVFESNDNAYLQVIIDGQPLAPRQGLNAVAYAFRATVADSLPGITVKNENVGIGTDDPMEKLDVAGRLKVSDANVTARLGFKSGQVYYGVQGRAEGDDSVGVFGGAEGSGSKGIHGVGDAVGVYGFSVSGSGVEGKSESFNGVRGETYGQGAGVYGTAAARSGINYGGYFSTNSPDGYAAGFEGGKGIRVSGKGHFERETVTADDNAALLALNKADNGVGVSGEGWIGVSGSTPFNNGYAGYFSGGRGVYVGNKFGIGIQDPQRQLHIGNGVLRIDRSMDSSSVIFHRNSEGGGMKSFALGVNASGVNDGEFFISDLGSAVSGGGARRLIIDNTGNVGIGTLSPASLLHLSSRGPVDILIEADSDNADENDQPSLTLSQDNGTVKGRLGYFNGTNDLTLKNEYDKGSLKLATGNTDRVIVDNDGKVDIKGPVKIGDRGPYIKTAVYQMVEPISGSSTSRPWFYINTDVLSGLIAMHGIGIVTEGSAKGQKRVLKNIMYDPGGQGVHCTVDEPVSKAYLFCIYQ